MKTVWVGEKQIKHSKKQGTNKGEEIKMSMAEGQKEPSKEQAFVFERSRNSVGLNLGKSIKYMKNTLKGCTLCQPRAGRLGSI